MGAFFDATCTKCKKRFGWAGTLRDKPKCPKCGHHDKPSEETIRELEEAEADLMKSIREKRKKREEMDSELQRRFRKKGRSS